MYITILDHRRYGLNFRMHLACFTVEVHLLPTTKKSLLRAQDIETLIVSPNILRTPQNISKGYHYSYTTIN